MATYTREQLESYTREQVRKMCTANGIVGMSKATKGECVDALFEKLGRASSSRPTTARVAASPAPGPVAGVSFTGQSTVTNPGGAAGSRITTTINVSCGATSGAFPVVGRTVREVAEFLREALNVDQLSIGLVNGQEVQPTYVLKAGDRLEFLKPAGKKGC